MRVLSLAVACLMLCTAASAATKKKPAAKPASSALSKAINAKLGKAQAALKAAQQRVALAAGPIGQAKSEHEVTKDRVAQTRRSIRGIENGLDDYVDDDTPFGEARRAYRAAAEQYERILKEARAEAESKGIKDALERLKFLRNHEPLVEANVKRAATSAAYARQRKLELQKSSSWVSARASPQQDDALFRAAE